MRRWMTSIWCVIQYLMNWSSVSVRGTPSTIASMLAPKVSCSCVCLKSWFSTTWATASRFSSMISRMPDRDDESSRTSEIPVSLPSPTSSAMRSSRLSGLTWYGSSVTTMTCRPRASSSTVTVARMVIEPRPVR